VVPFAQHVIGPPKLGGGRLLSGHDASAEPGPAATTPRAYDHRRKTKRKTDLKSRSLVGWIFALIWLMAQPAWAVEYCLEVTNVDALTFSSYMGKAIPWWAQ
jgi:hypothetical protein